jgi:hypothetical protein
MPYRISSQLFERRRPVIFSVIGFMALGITSPITSAGAAEADPLRLEAKIPLGEVVGRIDHMAIDLGRHRLFVAELGNDSVGVVDLDERKLLRRLTGLKEPQGTGYVKTTDTLYVANARDGSVRLFQGQNYSPAGRIDLGNDADNIRIDSEKNEVFVGYGSGGLAVIDPKERRKVADIPLKGHPESFQLDYGSGRIFVNVPDARAIAIVDRLQRKQAGNWPVHGASGNFPMALDVASRQVFVALRHPARMSAFAMENGTSVWSAGICEDSDDIFVDAKRQRIYVSCGEGFLDVFEKSADRYQRTAHVATVAGARTSLFVPELDILALAVRATRTDPASIWLYRSAP